MRIFETIRTANHNLLRNKVRTFLTMLAIFVGCFTIILTSAIHTGVNAFIDEQVDALGGEDFVMILPSGSEALMSSMMASSGPQEFTEDSTVAATAFTEQQIAELKNLDGLDADSFFSPRPIQGAAYVTSPHTDKRWSIIKSDVLTPGNVNLPLSAGTLTDDTSDKLQVILEPEFPQALGYANDEDIIGETITFAFQDSITKEFKEFEVEVVGVQANGIVAMSSGTYLSHALYDQLYAYATRYYPADYEAPTYYILASFDLARFTEAEIKQKLQDAGYSAITVSDMMGVIRSFFDAIMAVFTVFGAIALLAAAIGIVNTLLMSVEERTREIGLDKALGMSSGRVFVNFSVEAISLGFWGSLLGVVLAFILGTIVNGIVHSPDGILAVFPTFQLFKFTLGNVLPIILIVMLIAFISGTAPAWKAAHKNPIDALRYE